MIKIISLCQSMEDHLDNDIYSHVEEVIKYIDLVAKKDERKFC
jgi:hypothetical protein